MTRAVSRQAIDVGSLEVTLQRPSGHGSERQPFLWRALGGVRDIHRRFLEAYGMNWDEFPLLMLRPGNWEKPFVALAEGSG